MVYDCQQCRGRCRILYVRVASVGSQVVMDEQGGSRASDQDFALRQVIEKTIEKARVTCTHFSIKLTVRVVTLLNSY